MLVQNRHLQRLSCEDLHRLERPAQRGGPPDRPVDPEKPIDKYNCAGLAFRDYEWYRKPKIQQKIASDCVEGTLGQPCPKGSDLQCIYYDVTGVDFVFKGKVLDARPLDEFHIVCMERVGDRSCSKNGPGPIEGPGPIDSFPPKETSTPITLPDGVTLKFVGTRTTLCCNK